MTYDVIGKHGDLLTVVKEHKLRLNSHISWASGMTKTILRGAVNGTRRRGSQSVRSWFYQWYQWYTDVVQGSTNGTIGNTICTNGISKGTIGSPNGTIGKPMAPLATNGTIGKISNGTIGRTPNRPFKKEVERQHNDWIGLGFGEPVRAVENRVVWRRIVGTSFVVH